MTDHRSQLGRPTGPRHGGQAWLQHFSPIHGLTSHQRCALRLHNFARENIKLSVLLFAHICDFKRPRFVAADD